MNFRTASVLTIPALLAVLPSYAQTSQIPQPLLPNEEVKGCGTYFSLKNANHPQIFSLAYDSEEGLMRFNGKLYKLKMRKESKPKSASHQLSIGKKIRQIWLSEELTVTLSYKVSSSNEGAHQLVGKMLINLAGRNQLLKIWGETGCELNPA